jgi:hypothetical protein
VIALLLGNWQRIAVYAALVGLVLSLAELDGYRRGEKKLYEYQAQQATAAVAIVVKRGAITERVVTRYVKVREDRKEAADEIKKEVETYANTSACLDDDWRRLHDAAAIGALPRAPAAADDALRAAGADAGRDGDDGPQRAVDRR